MKRSFTLIEFMVVMGIFALLSGYVTVNLFSAKHKTSLNTAIDTIISDLKTQQLKAMIGDTEGRAAHDHYGAHFESATYTLFHGSAFDPLDSANFSLNAGDNIIFANVLFPNSEIIFESVSGEIAGFATGADAFTIKNTLSNEQKTLKLNQYGVITDAY